VPGGVEGRRAPGGALLLLPFGGVLLLLPFEVKLPGGVVLLAPRTGGGMVWRSSPAPLPVCVPVWRFLNSLQQLGHRHSATTSPEGVLLRVRRQPNWLLMSV
jgi:hypothetical protein